MARPVDQPKQTFSRIRYPKVQHVDHYAGDRIARILFRDLPVNNVAISPAVEEQ